MLFIIIVIDFSGGWNTFPLSGIINSGKIKPLIGWWGGNLYFVWVGGFEALLVWGVLDGLFVLIFSDEFFIREVYWLFSVPLLAYERWFLGDIGGGL